MAERLTLQLSNLETFAAWAVSQGFKREAAKSHAREILRLRLDKEPPLIFYQRNNVDYVTIPSGGTRTITGYALVTRWLRQRTTPTVADHA